jgi:hypothetical protein
LCVHVHVCVCVVFLQIILQLSLFLHLQSPLFPSVTISARSYASIVSCMSSILSHLGHHHLQFSCGTHFSTLLGHMVSSILLVFPKHINCHFCTSSVMFFSVSVISLLISFHDLSTLALLQILHRWSILFANSSFLFFLLISHASTPHIVPSMS